MPPQTPSVVDLLTARRRERSRPGARTDSFRLALVIEGGGMRGVVSGGMVCGLEALDLADAFDGVYGSSAGACAGAYFLAGQATLGLQIYSEDLSGSAFIRFPRAAIGRPIMNLDFVIDDVMRRSKPLDVERLLSRGVPFVVTATDMATGALVRLERFTAPEAVFEALRATTRTPVLGGDAVMVDGRQLMDGGVISPVPLELARDDGATHVLVLATRPFGARTSPVGDFAQRALRGYVSLRYTPAVAAAVDARSPLYDKRYRGMETGEIFDGWASALVLQPAEVVSMVETRPAVLHEAAERAMQAVVDRLDPERAVTRDQAGSLAL